jgi:hypothetical protein
MSSRSDEWSPDEPVGTEVFEPGDEATDEDTRLDPDLLESVELDPSLNRTLQVDDEELAEAGVEFDDPEKMAILDGGIDDPDGVGGRPGGAKNDDSGWNLDAPLASDDDDDELDV